jgi:hypothetical protein
MGPIPANALLWVFYAERRSNSNVLKEIIFRRMVFIANPAGDEP